MEITFKIDTAFDDVRILKALLEVIPNRESPVSDTKVDFVNETPDEEGVTEKEDDVELTPPNNIDVNGEAWSEIYHSSTKAKNADGSWKKRRGGPAKPEGVPTPTPTQASVSPSNTPPPPSLTVGVVIRRITERLKATGGTVGDILDILNINGVANISELQNHPDKWESILTQLEA